MSLFSLLSRERATCALNGVGDSEAHVTLFMGCTGSSSSCKQRLGCGDLGGGQHSTSPHTIGV